MNTLLFASLLALISYERSLLNVKADLHQEHSDLIFLDRFPDDRKLSEVQMRLQETEDKLIEVRRRQRELSDFEVPVSFVLSERHDLTDVVQLYTQRHH